MKKASVVASINQIFAAPAIKTTPTYINILPAYSGFLTKAYGPAEHSFFAPTFRVLVSPPAYETDQIRIVSPMNNSAAPVYTYRASGRAK